MGRRPSRWAARLLLGVALVEIASPGAARGAPPAAGPTTYVKIAAFPSATTYRPVYMNLPHCPGSCATPDIDSPASYRVQSPGAPAHSVSVPSGYSLRSVLADAGTGQAPGVVVLDGDHGPVVLSGSELTATPAPIVWIADDQVHFADAARPTDYLDVPAAGPQILIQTYPGHRLEVAASVTRHHLAPGARMAITATASGEKTGERLTYAWKQSGGAPVGSGSVLDRTWPAGSETVYAQVTGSDGSIGFSAPVTFTVGSAARGRPGPGVAVRGPRRRGTPDPEVRRPAEHGRPRARSPRATVGSATPDPAPSSSSTVVRTRTVSHPPSTSSASIPALTASRGRHPAPPPRHVGPLRSGIALAGPATPSARHATPRFDVASDGTGSARVVGPGAVGEGVWLAIGVGAAIAVGAVLQWSPRRRAALADDEAGRPPARTTCG